MRENNCTYCGKSISDEELKDVGNVLYECILHSSKNGPLTEKALDRFYIEFEKELKNDEIKDIIFPENDTYRFEKEIEKIKKDTVFRNCYFKMEITQVNNYMIFSGCTFSNHVLIFKLMLENKKVLFSKCTFDRNILFNKTIVKRTLFSYCKFNKNENVDIQFEDCELYENPFMIDSISTNIKFLNSNFNNTNLIFKDAIFYGDFKLIDCKNIKSLDFSNSKFSKDKKVKIQFSEINIANFNNTKFEGLADFYQSSFKEVNFLRAKFMGMAVFTKSIFYGDVDFKYVKFYMETIFRESIFYKELNLRETSFDVVPSFLDIKSKENKKYDIGISNRETARIIKDSFEQRNNILDSNYFYALEMKKRDKELFWKNDFFDKLVFKFHGLSSNHSQNWLLPIFWITILGLISTFFQPMNLHIIDEFDFLYKEIFTAVSIAVSTFVFILSLISFKYYYLYLIPYFGIVTSYVNFSTDIYFSDFANCINPFSIMTKGETLTFGSLIFKIIIAYLIYQLIISIRQNTRRK